MHLNLANNVSLDNLGTPIAAVTTDIDGTTRSASTPDMGADEFTTAYCAGTPAFAGTATVTPATATCAPANFALNPQAPEAIGLSYVWQSRTSLDSAWVTISGASANTYSPTGLTQTTYFQCVMTCSASGETTTSATMTALVNQAPVLSIASYNNQTGTSNTYLCSTRGGYLKVTGAATYTWAPTTNLFTAYNGTNPIGAYAGTQRDTVFVGQTNTQTTYTVTGVDALGCPSTKTVTVGPPILSLTSNPPSFCGTGGNITLLATDSASAGLTFNAGAWVATASGAPSLASATGNVVTTSNSATTTYSVTGAGSGESAGCSVTAYTSVGVYPLPTATVTTTASGVCPGTSATIGSGLAAGNFTATCITPVTALSTPPATAVNLILNGVTQTLPSGVTNPVTSLDDGYFAGIPIGFSFSFFTQRATQVYIGTNGTIVMNVPGASGSSSYTFTGGFPNSGNPASTVALAARDLRFNTPTGRGSLRYWIEGFAPNRRFIVQYADVPSYDGSGTQNTEAVFYETVGVIDMRIVQASNSLPSTATSAIKYIGLQDSTKSIGATAPRCSNNTANYWNGVTDTIGGITPQTWRFTPPANYRTIWSQTVGSTTTVIKDSTNKFSLAVSPTVTTLYSISYTNLTTGCTNPARSAEVNMVIFPVDAPTGVVTTSSVDSICASGSVNMNIDLTNASDTSSGGLTYIWFKSTDGGTTWDTARTSLGDAATTRSYTANPSTETSYRCQLKSCGGTASYSSTKTIYFKNYITATSGSSRCGNGSLVLSATPNTGASVNWYNAATGGSLVGTGSPATLSVNLLSSVTQYNNDFSSSTGVGVLSGSASLTGGKVQLTPSTVNSLGGFAIPASGINAQGYNVTFNMTTGGGGGADGLSYSFGDDASATDLTLAAEYGSGSKLKIGFDDYGTGSVAAAGIRLIYGASINDPGQVAGTNEVLAYSSNISWVGTTVPVNISISSSGLLSLSVNGATIFSNIQLPAGYASANKSTWQHVFKSRCGGGASMIHAIDDLTLAYSIPSPSGGTSTFWAVAVSDISCEGVRVPVNSTITPAPAFTLDNNTFAICNGQTSAAVHLTVGGGDYDQLAWTPSAGVTGSAIDGWSFNPTATTTFTLNGTQSAGTCSNSATVTVTVNPLPTISSATATPATVCAGSPVTLTASSISGTAGTATIGVSSTTYSTTGNPYRAGYGVGSDVRTQLLYTASELSAAGIGAGNITSVSFNLTSVSGTMANFKISIGSTSNIDLTTSYLTSSMTEVVNLATYTPVVGANTHTFSTPFYWDGTSNIVLNICQTNSALGTTIISVYTPTNTGDLHNGGASICTTASGTTYANKPVVVFGAFIGVNNTSSLNFTWTPGNITGSTVTVNPQSSSNYQVTATNPTTGCNASSASSVSVTVNPLPTSPETSNSDQCGSGVPTCFATGTSNGNYRWFLDAAGTQQIVGQVNNSLSGYSISETTTFYVGIYNGTCLSLLSPVTATVRQPDAITASASNQYPCVNTAIDLSVAQTGTTQNYTYAWTASPATGSGIPTSVSGASVSVTPTSASANTIVTYTVTGTDATLGCVVTSTIQVAPKPVPTITTSTATPSTVCAGTTVTLNGTSIDASQGIATIGSGGTTTSTYNAPFYSLWSNKHMQMLFPASELAASGLLSGNISSISFPTTSGTVAIVNVTIKMGHTTASNMNSFVSSGLTPVFSAASLAQTANTDNTVALTTPFNWDGTSNIVMEICFGSGSTTATLSSTSPADNTSYVSVIKTHSTTATVGSSICNDNATNVLTYSVRPVVKFNGITGVNNTNAYTFNWNPGNQTGSSVSVTPNTTTAYTLTVTNPGNACSSTATVTVTVNQLPPAPSASGSDQCGTGIPAASVSSNSGAATPTYKWYTVAVNGTPIQTGTSTTYLGSITTTTTYYVSEVSAAGCEGPRVELTATVTPPDPIQAILTAHTICLNNTFDISASYTPDANTYGTYDLSVTPLLGSGLTGTTSLVIDGSGYATEPLTITPTVPGKYYFTITATDPDKGCVSSVLDSVVVSGLPVVDSVKANITALCAGGTVTLNAYSSVSTSLPASTTPLTYAAPGTTSPASSDNIILVQFGTINNATTYVNTAGFDNYINTIAATSVDKGSAYSLTVNVSNGGTEYAGVWFDWDRNGVYDASEFTNIPIAVSGSNYVGTISVTIPTTASAGTIGMRVRSSYSTALTSASAYTAYTYGETEDYAVYITGSTIQTVLVNPGLRYTWTPGSLIGSTVSVTPSITTNYSCVATDTITGCSSLSSSTVTINVSPLPSVPVGTASVQCGAGVPSVSVAPNDVTSTLNWYNSATPATVTTLYSNDFTTANFGAATLSGVASRSSNKLILTPASVTQLGGFTIPASGVNAQEYTSSFKISVTAAQSGADGMSYSFAPDADATSTAINAEMGTGSKLKISFDIYGTSGNDVAGIRVIYGNTTNTPGQVAGTNGVLAYSASTSWSGIVDVPVVVNINAAGKLTLTVNGAAVFTNLQLPASFVTDDKSTWKHVFKARSGGVAGLHAIDDLVLQYFNSGLVNTGTTYSQSIAQTTTFYVSETSAAGCTGPRVAVTATVNQPDTLVASSNGPICIGSPVTLTATVTSGGNNNTYGLTWSAAAAASGITGSTSGGTASYGSPASITVTPTAAGTYTFTLNGTDGSGALTCSATSSVSVVVNALPVIDSVSASKTTICAGTNVTLQGYSASLVSGPQTLPTGYASSTATSTSDDEIFNVTINGVGLNNSSTCSTVAPGAGSVAAMYSNYTTLTPTTLYANTAYTGSITIGMCATGTYTTGYAVFIDLNRDGTFGAGETMYTAAASATNALTGTVNPISFTIPTSATAGVTMMRIVAIESSTGPAATGTYTWGETEDYAVNIIGRVLTNPALTYTWNPGAVSNSTGTAIVSPTTTTTYTMSLTNATTGCAALATQSVTVTVVPVSATATKSVSGASCSGSPVTLTANPVGQGPFTYVWTLNGQITSLGVLSTLTVSPTATTTYAVTVKDACSNPTTATVTVTVNALPTVSIVETSPISICAPNTQTLTANPSVTTVTYQWLFNGANISGATSATYAAGSTGSYTVKVTDTTIGCTSAASAAVVLTINNRPAAFAITPASASISYGGSVALAATGGNTTTNNVDALAETFDGSATGWNVLSSVTSPAGGVWQYKTAPYTASYSAGGTAFTNFSTTQGGKFAMAFSDQGGAGSNDSTMISSPVFNTTNFTSANLVFEQLYYNFSGDVTKVQISTNGGTSWTDLATYSTNQGTITAGGQVTTTTTISMASYLNQTNLKVRFFYRSSYGYYWVVDNVKVTGTTVVAPSSWTWSPSAGLNTASGTSVTAAPTQTTTYTLTATNFGGCIRTKDVQVRVRPTAVISGTQFLCNGSSANLSVAVTGNGPWSGTLSNGATFSGSTSPITVSVSPSTTTTYTLATLNDATDTATATQLSGSAIVTIRPRPTAVISGTTSLPNGTTTATLSIAVTGTGSWSGTLSNGQSFSGSTSPISVIVTPSTTTTYTIATLIDANCTSVSGDLTGSATVSIRPTAVISGTQNVCTGSTSATLSIAVSGNGPWSGTLSNGATFSGSTSPISVIVTPSATTTYTVATLSDASGTSQADDLTGSATVTVNPRPTAVISGTSTICNAGSTTLTVTFTGTQPYSVTYTDGTTPVTVNGITTSTYAVSVSPSSTKTYTVTALSDANCTAIAGDMTGTAVVSVNPRPTAVISGGASYCAGTIPPTTTLQVLVTTTGSWSGTLSNGQAFSGSGTGSVNITVTNPTVSTTYTVATLVNSGSTCAAQAGDLTGSATIALNARPTAVISGTQAICSGLGETANLTVALTGVAPYSVSYSNGTSTTTVTSATNSLTIPVSPTVTTTYTLVSVSDANACSTVGGDVSGSAFVTLNPYTPSSIQGPINVCPFVGRDTILKYTVPAVPGVINYTWVVNSAYIQLVTSATNSTPIAYNSLTGYSTPSNVLYVKMLVGFIQQSAAQIRVKATTRCGTSAYTSFVIVAQLPGAIPYPTASTADVCPSIGTNVPIIYKITKSVGALQYFWSITTNGVSNPNAHITHLVSGANDTAISVTFDAGFTTSVLSVYTTNDCGIGGTRTLTITRNVPGSPSLISGPGSSCEYMNNSTGGGLIATYSVGAMTGVTSYYWTIPAGSTNISGETTNSISFKYPMTYTGGTISVRAINNCGVGADRSLSIGVGAIFPPSGIDVTPGTCPNRVYTYTVSVLPFGATSLSWTYPVGATVSAQTLTSISLLYPNTVVDGVVTVRAVSNCRISAEKTKIVKLGACQSGPSTIFTKGDLPIVKDNMEVSVFPNPSTSSFNLLVKTSTNGTFKARVMDVLGREVTSFTGERDNTIKFGNELKAGVYMIEVREGESLKTVRVVKY